MAKIIGYARVSSREQAENSHALEQQIERLKAAGATEILFDVESGTKRDRDSLNRVMQLIRTRGCDAVLVTRLDRLTRSLVHMRKVIDEFQQAGVGLRSLDDAVDFTTAAGRFHLNMLGALAEMEVDRLSERVRHGWGHLRSRKIAMNPPFGYLKINDKHYLDHRPFLCLLQERREMSKAEIARELVEAYLSQKSLRLALRCINQRYGIQTFAHNNAPGRAKGGKVAREMFRFSVPGFSNWLTNPVLQGHLAYLRGQTPKNEGRLQIHYDTHPDQRLISDEEARQIEELLNHNRQVRGYGSTALKYPLSGLVFCGECRSSCYSLTGQNNYHRSKRLGLPPEMNYYFQCKNWRLRSCNQKKAVRMEVAEAAVVEALLKRVEAIANFAETPVDIVEPPELLALREELRFLQSSPNPDRVSSAIVELQSQIETFRRTLQQKNHLYTDNQELLLTTFANPQFWELGLTEEEKREVYRALVERVVVKEGSVVEVRLRV